jgi:uncharacterized protein
MNSDYEKIYAFVKSLTIIDTHEHLPAFENLRSQKTDILAEYLSQYFSSDLKSAGLTEAAYQQAIDISKPLMERWRMVEPYWENCRHTGYGRALDLTARDIYGLPGVKSETIEELNRLFLDSLSEEHFKQILSKHSKIAVGLLHAIPKDEQGKLIFTSRLKCDNSFFRSVYPVDRLIFPQEIEDIKIIERETGISITCFEEWLAACDVMMESALKHGAVAFKSAHAYQREIRYDSARLSDAQAEFDDLFSYYHMGTYLPSYFYPGKNFQNYMMHRILKFANCREFPFQFHTGIQEGNGNIVSNSDPALLTPLFLRYPNVRFDIFHMGYPYEHVLSALAKNFPNVFIDMCWAHIVSPEASVQALSEWIEAVPINKISAFGGDYLFIDGVYGHQYIARENVSRVLAEKVSRGLFDLDRAKQIATLLFYGNPKEIFKLDNI